MQIFVKPAVDLVVLDHDGKPVPKEGMEVTRTSFWVRRLASGDVVVAEAPLKEEN